MYLFEDLKLDSDGSYTTMDKNLDFFYHYVTKMRLYSTSRPFANFCNVFLYKQQPVTVTSYSHATCASGTECEMASVVFSSVWLILGCVSVRRKRESYRVVDVQREVKRYSSCCLRACWWGGLPVD